MKILAVDDDALTLGFLTEVLRQHGYTDLSTAENAAEAAEMIAAASEPFECFLLDIAMPEVDGIELCRWIRRSARHRTTPILMTTALSDKPFIDRAFLAGATDYVTKPFDAADLTTRLRLAEHQMQSGALSPLVAQAPGGLQAHMELLGHVALSEPGALKDVAGLIEYAALENYLLQLARGSFFGTSAVALRIVDVGDIYAKCSCALFRDILADVAACAVRALRAYDCVLSYAGNGIFAGVVGAVLAEDLDAVEQKINQMLDKLDLVDDLGKPITVLVAMGPPRPVGIMKSGRVAVALLRRAIEDIVWNARRPAAVSTTPKAAPDDLTAPLVLKPYSRVS
jgi:CheY-like chemotaxis protein